MRYLTITFLLAAVAAVLAGCGGGGGQVPSGAVAQVDNQTITQSQFDQLLAQAKRSYKIQKRTFPKAGTSDYEALKTQAVAYLVQRAELAQEGQKLGVTISDKEINDRLAQIKKQFLGGSEARYQKQLKQQGLTEAQVKDDIKNELIQEKIFKKVTADAKVSDADVKKYYDQHKSQYGTPEQRVVAHILVKKKSLADQLYNRLKAGANFAALAKKYSQDPGSKTNGGKLTISKGQTVATFDQMAFLLRTGAISRPVKSDYGYHIIKALSNIKPATVTAFAKVKASIKQTLLQQKKNQAMQDWSSKLKKDFNGKVSYQTGYAPPSTSTNATTTG
jgi:foldase protein PrsA